MEESKPVVNATTTSATQSTVEVKIEEPKQEIKEDLITRASQVKLEPQPEKGIRPLEEEATNFKTVEDAIRWAEKKERAWESGYTKKFQELAELRKSLESKKTENVKWTPERIQQELLRDPTFVQAAQQVAGSQEESALTADDRKLIEETRQASLIAQQEAFRQQKMLEDEKLRTKYKNYNPEAVDIVTADLLEGKEKATREHLWKVLDYEDFGKRCYALGKQDRATEVNEKINASSPTGYTAVSNDTIKPEKGESNSAYWNRVVAHNLVKASREKEIRK